MDSSSAGKSHGKDAIVTSDGMLAILLVITWTGSVRSKTPAENITEKGMESWCEQIPEAKIYSDGNFYDCIERAGAAEDLRIKSLSLLIRGKRFNVGIIPVKSFSSHDKKSYDYDCSGYTDGNSVKPKPAYSSYILNLLREILGFEVEYVRADTWGAYDPEGKNWSGLVGLALENRIHLGICHTTITEDRVDAVDFLLSTLASTRSLVYDPRKLPLTRDVFVLTFSPTLWLSFFASTVLLVLCFKFSTWAHSKLRPDHEPWSWIEVIMWANAAICQQSYSRHPKGSSCRTTFLIGYLICYLLYTGFAAGVTSLLAVRDEDISLDFQDLLAMKLSLVIQSDSTHFKFLKNSPEAHAKSFYDKTYLSLQENRVESSSQLFKKLQIENHVGLGTTVALQNYLKRKGHKKFKGIAMSPILGSFHQKAFLLPKNSPHKELFNYWLLRLMETGLLDFGMRKYIYMDETESRQHPGWSSAGLGHVKSAAIILGGGWFFSIVIFSAEILRKRNEASKKWEQASTREIYDRLTKNKKWL